MDDKKAQSEAWVRKKPKRIIQNQALIVFCIILTLVTPIPLSGLVLWLVFGVYPSIVIPAILVSWVIAATFFLAIRLKELKNKI